METQVKLHAFRIVVVPGVVPRQLINAEFVIMTLGIIVYRTAMANGEELLL